MNQAAKKLSLAALAGAGLMLGASAAQADFLITASTPVAAGAGFERINVSAFNNGLNGTGTKLLAFDVTATTPGTTTATAFKVDFTHDLDSDGVNDANILGTGLTTTSSLGTFMSVGSFNLAGLTPANNQTDPSHAAISSPPNPADDPDLGTPTPTQAVDPAYTNLHSFEIAGFDGNGGVAATTGAGAIFAHIVIPTGGTPSFTLTGAVGGDTGNTVPFTFVFPVPNVGAPIVSLTAAAPSGFGSNVGSLAITGGNGSYTLAQKTGLTGTSGFLSVGTFNPSTDAELYGLDILVGGVQATPAQLAALVADINLAGGQTGGLVASNNAATLAADGFPSIYNLLLTNSPGSSATDFIGFNLANAPAADVTNFSVAAVAVVPEPASAAGLLIGACGLLAGRRRKTA